MNQTVNKKINSNNTDGKFSIYFSDFVKGAKKFWWVCVALAVIIGGVNFYDGYSNYVPFYTASATFTVSTQTSSGAINGISAYSFYYDASTASQLSDTFPYILSCNLLQEAICEDLDLPAMAASLSATSVAGSNMFTLSATGNDAQTTYDILMSAIENYPDVAKYVVGNVKLDMITTPKVPEYPSNKFDFVDIAIDGVIIGFVIGLAVIILYAIQRRTVKTKKELANEFNLSVLGVLPKIKFKKHSKPIDCSLLITNNNIGNSFTESMRILRNKVTNALRDSDKILMVTSTAPAEGKTTVSVNIALSLAAKGSKVLIADADVRHPSVANLLGLDENTIDYDVITDRYNIAKLTDVDISFMTFNCNTKELEKTMNIKEVKQVLSSVRDDYDYVIVDTPPCGLISDAHFFAQAVDAVIYVVAQDTVRISRIRSSLDSLMSTNADIIGCVLNGTASGVTGYGYGGYGYGGYGKYGYGYGYGRGYGSSSKTRKR